MKDNHTPESCPFCGCHEIEKWKEDAPSFMGMRFHLSCTECFCDIYSNTPEEAIKAWNTRAESDLLGECLDALNNLYTDIENLIAESGGVQHLHLNGDIADWDWLINNGWLGSLDEAKAILAKRKGEK